MNNIKRLSLIKISTALLISTLGFQQSLQASELIVAKRAAPAQQTPPKPGEAINQPKIEVVFVLDTTGSMSGLIKAAKEKIWSIAGTMAQASTAPHINMGLVAYRDRGDAYITRTIDLSDDLDSMYSKLMDFRAAGGGDGPESVNQAIYDAVHKMSWSQDQNTYKVIFLVGDAPAHMDYQNDVQYPQTINIAQDKGIVINAIQSGTNGATTRNWKRIAKLGQGHYFRVENSGNAVAIATPFDDELAELSKKMDRTRIYYGNAEEKRKQKAKVAASEKLHRESSTASQARRATYNMSISGKLNFLGKKELVAEIVSGDVALESIEEDALPAELQVMKPAARQSYIEGKDKERKALGSEIKDLAEKRDAYLKKKVEATGLGKNSLDAQIFDAIKEQSADKGLVYDKKDMKF
ncbi:MAG: VWA domain-containing protein [Leucothrix sp.]